MEDDIPMALWASRKAQRLADLADSSPDKSPKGSLDTPIADFVMCINECADYVTTSSCSGRITVFQTYAGAKKGGTWLLCKHGKVTLEEVTASLDAQATAAAQAGPCVFRHEPFILAVECRSLRAASALCQLAIGCGFRESGITSMARRYNVSVRCSLRIEAPVADAGRVLVPNEYLDYLVNAANAKFDLNVQRVDNFFRVFQEQLRKGGNILALPPALKTKKGKKLKSSPRKPRDKWLKLTERQEKVLSKLDGLEAIAGSAAAAKLAKDGRWCIAAPRRVSKALKDALKQRGWLDTTRQFAQVPSLMGPAAGRCSALRLAAPLTDKGLEACRPAARKGDGLAPLLGLPEGTELRLRLVALKQPRARVAGESPLGSAVAALLVRHGAPELQALVPKRWELLGDVVLLPSDAFAQPEWAQFTDRVGANALWSAVAEGLRAKRVARQRKVAQGIMRESQARMLLGADGWVKHRENSLWYCLDVTKSMFSSGNGTEKRRMGQVCREGDVVLDLYAGIGYFTLPFLVHGKAAHVHACELNPNSVEGLRKGLLANRIDPSRCTVYEGDNRRPELLQQFECVADRVSLGLLPDSDDGWPIAIHALKPSGGWLHVHNNVDERQEAEWVESMLGSLRKLAEASPCAAKHTWTLRVEHISRVKSYAPHVKHIVVDVECTRSE